MPLQRATWGDESEGGLIPAQMLIHLVRYGGHVLAAYWSERLVGFIVGYIGLYGQQVVMASKRMMVLPPFRNRGIARELKLAQRALAIEQGIPLITWTFSPCLSLNAHFNLVKLGAVGRRYDRNVYGSDNSLATLGSSDRMLVEYWVKSKRVCRLAERTPQPRPLTQLLEQALPIVNPSERGRGNWRACCDASQIQETPESRILVEIPANFADILREAPNIAVKWQEQLRWLLLKWLNGRAFSVTDLWHGQLPGEGCARAYYLLERKSDDLC